MTIDLHELRGHAFRTVLADPPWRFTNRHGKMAPEHHRLRRYSTLALDTLMAMPVAECVADTAHLYLWVPNAMLPQGLQVMAAWGFTYKNLIIWNKVRKDGGSDGGGVGFYFRNATEILLFGLRYPTKFRYFFNSVTESLMFGTRGRLRTLAPARRQINVIMSRRRGHSRKPDEQYDLIEACSPGPFLELFARQIRPGWQCWGNEVPSLLPPSLDHVPSPLEALAPTTASSSRRSPPVDTKRLSSR